jgi:tetratricopeptide (TPR) repeat protein
MEKLDLQTQNDLVKAINALKEGKANDTITICEDYLLTSPGSVAHLQLFAHALIKQEKLESAQEKIDFAITISPDFAPLYEDLGSIQALKENYNAAIISFKKAIQLDPRISGAHKKLAQALAASGRNNEVDEAFEGYLDHDDEAALVAAGAEHWRAGRLSDAEAVFVKTMRKNPNNLDAMRFLAMVYQGQNKKLDDAEALLRRATSMAPDFHQAFGNLGRVLIDNGKWEDAIECYKTLLELKPEDDTAWAGLGRSYTLSGQVDKSITAYEKSLAINEQSASVHLAYAHMLKTVGRQADALIAYRNSIRYKPQMGESYWSMANLKIFSFEPKEVSAMEHQLTTDDLTDSARIHFHFSLGKAYEDNKDYDKAWHHYQLGNETQRSTIHYDPVENELHLKHIREVFNSEIFASHQGAGYDAVDPIFIVGLPRSGSTLIEQILASHSQVEGTSELPNIGSIAVGTSKFRHDGLAYPHTMKTLIPRDFAAYGKEYLQQIAHHRVQGTPFFIDKMPNNFAHVGWIKKILPNAKIINTRRHPVDSCLGAYKQLFAKGQYFTYEKFELAEFYRSYIDIMQHWHDVLPGQILDVHYEDTVTDLETQVRKILDFCGLEFEESCLRFYETERAVKTASSEQVRQPIYTGALGLWKKYGDNLNDWQDDLADIIEQLPESVKKASQ